MTGSVLNALDLYMRWSLFAHILCSLVCIDVTLCTRSVNCLLALLHFWWWTGMPLDHEHFYTLNVFLITIYFVKFLTFCYCFLKHIFREKLNISWSLPINFSWLRSNILENMGELYTCHAWQFSSVRSIKV